VNILLREILESGRAGVEVKNAKTGQRRTSKYVFVFKHYDEIGRGRIPFRKTRNQGK
jgi:hypothetical protein